MIHDSRETTATAPQQTFSLNIAGFTARHEEELKNLRAHCLTGFATADPSIRIDWVERSVEIMERFIQSKLPNLAATVGPSKFKTFCGYMTLAFRFDHWSQIARPVAVCDMYLGGEGQLGGKTLKELMVQRNCGWRVQLDSEYEFDATDLIRSRYEILDDYIAAMWCEIAHVSAVDKRNAVVLRYYDLVADAFVRMAAPVLRHGSEVACMRAISNVTRTTLYAAARFGVPVVQEPKPSTDPNTQETMAQIVTKLLKERQAVLYAQARQILKSNPSIPIYRPEYAQFLQLEIGLYDNVNLKSIVATADAKLDYDFIVKALNAMREKIRVDVTKAYKALARPVQGVDLAEDHRSSTNCSQELAKELHDAITPGLDTLVKQMSVRLKEVKALTPQVATDHLNTLCYQALTLAFDHNEHLHGSLYTRVVDQARAHIAGLILRTFGVQCTGIVPDHLSLAPEVYAAPQPPSKEAVVVGNKSKKAQAQAPAQPISAIQHEMLALHAEKYQLDLTIEEHLVDMRLAANQWLVRPQEHATVDTFYEEVVLPIEALIRVRIEQLLGGQVNQETLEHAVDLLCKSVTDDYAETVSLFLSNQSETSQKETAMSAQAKTQAAETNNAAQATQAHAVNDATATHTADAGATEVTNPTPGFFSKVKSFVVSTARKTWTLTKKVASNKYVKYGAVVVLAAIVTVLLIAKMDKIAPAVVNFFVGAKNWIGGLFSKSGQALAASGEAIIEAPVAA